ncbi:MAG: hypothetical protein GF333_03990 [Candidatus Omnitrophica bacterium]|nr:hypothetical protein [Candidatus Omnitrophota bacterium]
MKKLLVLSIAVIMTVSGCTGAQQAKNGDEAIANAERMETKDEKVEYLTRQAEGLLRKEQYEEVLQVGRYLWQELNARTQTIMSLMDEARKEMQAAADAAGSVKDQMQGMMSQ